MASIFEAVAGKAIGYPEGTGGAVVQETSKATGVTLSKPAGEITTHDASVTGGAEVSFVVTNTFVGINDVPVVAIQSGATTGTYVASVSAVAAGSFTITLSNVGSTAAEVLVLNFAVIKGAEA
jgi:hypothetical protein